MIPPASQAPQSRTWLDFLSVGLVFYYFTALVAVLGVLLGHHYLKPPPHPAGPPGDLPAAFARWDGQRYVEILQNGYSYDPGSASNIAFFPAFPLLGRAVAWLT